MIYIFCKYKVQYSIFAEEAKAHGIKMGEPLHFIQDLVYSVLDYYSRHIERYSSDESLIFLSNMPFRSLSTIATTLRRKVQQWTGIPVTVGLVPNKTLAKLANRYAKKKFRDVGVYALDSQDKINEVLNWWEIGGGVGHWPPVCNKAAGYGNSYRI